MNAGGLGSLLYLRSVYDVAEVVCGLFTSAPACASMVLTRSQEDAMITIDAATCIGDGRCVETCPTRAFVLDDEGKAAKVPPDLFRCLGCGHCVSVCPVNAITLEGDTSEQTPPAPEQLAEQVAWLIKTRRSIRWFKPEPIPREALQRALDVARYAPTARNLQEVTWIAADDPGRLKKVADLTAAFLLESPATAPSAKSYFDGQDTVLRGAPTLLLAQAPEDNWLSPQDCAAAVSYLEFMLHARGIGSCWSGYVIRAAQKVPALRALLGVKEGCQVFAGLLIGYSMEQFQRIPGRKPVRIDWL